MPNVLKGQTMNVLDLLVVLNKNKKRENMVSGPLIALKWLVLFHGYFRFIVL